MTDIIIPVYGAAAELRACLARVVRETDLARHRLLLVIDGPQDRDVESAIEGFEVLRNQRRRGFVASANRGMQASTSDVVLLNSDTIVTPRWLEKLIDAADSDPRIGTVTPLSNHATLCSVPRGFEENLLPAGHDAASFAELVERVSMRSYPRLPTGVGVCFFIRRALLDDIGYFDAERFGLGYGEENDFCMRALARGWVHVADDATFIYHAGHRSFGTSRVNLQRRAAATLDRLHPGYMPLIAEFMKDDPLAEVRARIRIALGERNDGRKIVHLVHGWPPFQHAGTEMYAYWLAHRQRASVYARFADPQRADGEAVEYDDRGIRVRLVNNNFTARNPFRRNALWDRKLERDFARFLREETPDLVHIHHLAGHAFSLAKVARKMRVPVVMQIQDWWFLCARVNFFDREGKRCSGPAAAKCAACATLTRVPPAGVTNRVLHWFRRRVARGALGAGDAFIVGSEAIRRDYSFLRDVHVIPYGVDCVGQAPSPVRTGEAPVLHFGYVGSISAHKGVHTAVEAMRGLEATLHVWGNAGAYPEYTKQLDGAVLEGTFREEDKVRVFASMDVLIVPSIGLESFGLAAREAMACGVPVIATRGGALDELEGAEFFPAGDADALRAIVQRLIDDPSSIDRWRARLPVPKRNDEHAAEVERVYDAVLSR